MNMLDFSCWKFQIMMSFGIVETSRCKNRSSEKRMGILINSTLVTTPQQQVIHNYEKKITPNFHLVSLRYHHLNLKKELLRRTSYFNLSHKELD